MGNPITQIDDDTSGTTSGKERQNCLDGDTENGYVEGLEHNLGHLLPAIPGVHRSFGEENGMFFGSDAKLIVEGMVPDIFHAVPVGCDATLDRVLEGQYIAFDLGFVALSEFSGRGYYPTDTNAYPTWTSFKLLAVPVVAL